MEGLRPSKEVNELTSLIWAVVVILVVLWLLGWSFQVGGSLIFLLLVLAIAGVIYNLVAGGMYGGTRHHHHATDVTEVEHHDV
jgi:high-affinity Fe2+/Pb2+ permease